MPPKTQLPMVYLMVTNPLTTALNIFGIFQNYLFHPSYDPDSVVGPDDLSNLGTHACPSPTPQPDQMSHEPPWPFSNIDLEVNEMGEYQESVEV